MQEENKKHVIFEEVSPFDPRFPNVNKSTACFYNYLDYHRCLDLLGDDPKCEYLKLMTSICPNHWIEKWDEQREAGTFPNAIFRVPKDYCERKANEQAKKKQ